MTNEEAIEELKREIHNAKVTHHLSEHYEMAINALEQLPDIKDAYNKGYKDGQEALAFHLELCKEEQEPVLDKIKAEIDRQEKWLLQAGCTAYNVDIALDAIKTIVAESEG